MVFPLISIIFPLISILPVLELIRSVTTFPVTSTSLSNKALASILGLAVVLSLFRNTPKIVEDLKTLFVAIIFYT
jgi:hypothetical protein